MALNYANYEEFAGEEPYYQYQDGLQLFQFIGSISRLNMFFSHPNFHLRGTFPQDWSDMSLSRRRFSTIKFIEYLITDFVTENFVTNEEAKRQEKNELEKITREELESL
ncbi:hypothetical protein DAPPUDRAFT_333417 [Daphnia pulex]|uniref:Uncharacterized protein n=1 Tax=Daphnia pulex TaxID=6669 RepID=E9HSR5_DAPPU|nr:hypothetical protein DAPPUDRAFT_333417 [Daphnia pulex]|eukprot:EFX65208.1 hypothetical protein DAPPUDRAFT_333417 [Daphnia pulex]